METQVTTTAQAGLQPKKCTVLSQKLLATVLTWNPAEPVPATLSLDVITEAITIAENLLQPVPEKPLMVLISSLMAFGRAFDKTIPDPKLMVSWYHLALAKLPGDVVQAVIADVCTNWKWGRQMPQPGDLTAAAAPEIARRRVALNRLQLAQRKAARGEIEALPWPKQEGELKPETVAALNELRAAIGKPLKALDSDFAEQQEHGDSLRRANAALAGFKLSDNE